MMGRKRMIIRENMERWIQALETYEGTQARGALVERDKDGKRTMCAVGIGLNEFGLLDTVLYKYRVMGALIKFRHLLGLETTGDPERFSLYEVDLKPDDSGHDEVTGANDIGEQSPWTIAQRLRETYLKEEQ